MLSKSQLIALIIFIITLICFFSFKIKLAYMQMIIFPFFAFILFLFFKNKIPKLIFIFSFIFASLGVLKNFEFLNTNTSNFYIARFEEDNFEAKTTLIRKKIRRYLKNETNVELKRHYGSFNNFTESNDFLIKNKNIEGLIWAGKQAGEVQDLFLSFPVKKAVSFSNLLKKINLENPNKDLISILSKIRLFKSVPLVTLPDNSKLAGPAFLAEIISGIKLNDELKLKSAATMRSNWNISDHLVFARFKLGVLYVEKFVKTGFQDLGYLKCSLESFKNAERISNLLPKSSVFYGTLEYNSILASLLNNFYTQNLDNLKNIKFRLNLLVKFLRKKIQNNKIQAKYTEIQAKRIVKQAKNLIKVSNKLKKHLKSKN